MKKRQKRTTWTVEPEADVRALVDTLVAKSGSEGGRTRGMRTDLINNALRAELIGGEGKLVVAHIDQRLRELEKIRSVIIGLTDSPSSQGKEIMPAMKRAGDEMASEPEQTQNNPRESSKG